jgi:hypothetical protein
MRRPDISVGLRRSDFCPGVFHNRCTKILTRGLSGLLDTRSCVFRSRPKLKLLEQDLGCRPADFGLNPVTSFTKQSNFVARQRYRCAGHRSCGFRKQRERISSRENREDDR